MGSEPPISHHRTGVATAPGITGEGDVAEAGRFDMTRGGASRRDAIIPAALRLFGSRGYDATSLEQVAEAVGVRKQSLLYHFPSKEALFDACVEEFADAVREALTAAIDDPAEGWDRVERVIRAVFALARERPELPQFAREAARKSHETVQRVAVGLEPLRLRALAHLEEGMARGAFRRQDPGLLLFTLYTAVVGSLTEAGVVRAVAGESTGAAALARREEELIAFVRHALLP